MKKSKKCLWCGKKFNGRGKYCSYDHSYNAMKEANRQLKEKEGPIYDKWKKNLEDSLNELFRGGSSPH